MILEKFKLDGRVALVTGCNRGLGAALALAMAEAGADVAGVYNSTAQGVQKDIQALGRTFLGIQADLGQPSVAEGIVEQVVQKLGTVDILINNAGIIRRNDALDFTESDWDDVMNVNLRGLFFLTQAAAKRMVAQGRGKIIHVASMLSYQGGIRVSSYTASKSGVLGLTRIMANEWAAKGVNVNAIAPGYMVTDNTAALRADEARNRQILERIPAGRWGEPEDLKGCAVFLASSASDYLHGFTIAVDGGWLAR